MLIRDAEIIGGERVDVRIAGTRIEQIGPGLSTMAGEPVIDAAGAALLPGLHDHHLHLQSLAAAMASLRCGPPQVVDAAALAQALHDAAQRNAPGDWIRGIGYHPSVAGDIDRDWIDRVVTDRPVRIQHRSGRLWILNSCALDLLQARIDEPPERIAGKCTGRLYDADTWLRRRLGTQRPKLHALSRRLARYGLTGLTDTTPHNGPDECAWFAQARARGELPQDLLVMGDDRLHGISQAPRKFHLHEHALPDFDALVAAIRSSHEAGRAAAFHCVTRTELVFVLEALRQAGSEPGDRIEHAGVAPPEFLDDIAAQRLTVVTQPNFIAERGDAYLRDVTADDQPWLYRLRGFLDAGIALAGSTDAPFGEPDPWAAMQAAVSRQTQDGAVLGAGEALTPEQALALFTTPLAAPGAPPAKVEVGTLADLCLLTQPWSLVRCNLAAVEVRLTVRAGVAIWSRDEEGRVSAA